MARWEGELEYIRLRLDQDCEGPRFCLSGNTVSDCGYRDLKYACLRSFFWYN